MSEQIYIDMPTAWLTFMGHFTCMRCVCWDLAIELFSTPWVYACLLQALKMWTCNAGCPGASPWICRRSWRRLPPSCRGAAIRHNFRPETYVILPMQQKHCSLLLRTVWVHVLICCIEEADALCSVLSSSLGSKDETLA